MNFSLNPAKLYRLPLLCVLLCAVASGAPRAVAQDDCDDPKPHVEATPKPVPPKDWSPGPGIGVVVDEKGKQLLDEDDKPIFDGRMTAPVDQTQPNVPTQVLVRGKGKLACAVEEATDMDTWTQDDGDPCTPDSGHESDIVTYKWTADGGEFIGGTDGRTAQWQAPSAPGSYAIYCTINDKPTALVQDDPTTEADEAETGNRDDYLIIRSCNAIVPNLILGSLEPIVAIGAVDNAAHKTKFTVSAYGPAGERLSGVDVIVPIIASGGRGPRHAITAKVEMDSYTTDDAGLVSGTFTSGNRQEDTILQIKSDPFDPDSILFSTLIIAQVWSQLDDEESWSYDPYFDYNVPSTVTFNMAYYRGGEQIPIPGHSLEPLVSSISGYEWNPYIGDDWDGDGFPDGEYELVKYKDDDDDMSGFNWWKNQVEWGGVTDNGGSYSVDQTVWWDDDFITDFVRFWMWDNDAYGPNGAED